MYFVHLLCLKKEYGMFDNLGEGEGVWGYLHQSLELGKKSGEAWYKLKNLKTTYMVKFFNCLSTEFSIQPPIIKTKIVLRLKLQT